MSELVLVLRGAISFPLERLGIVGPVEHVAAGSKPESGSRLYALDLARFIAMCFMMQGHVLDALVSRDLIVTTEFPWNVWHLIRGFTAPVFLMVSGAVHAFATKRDADGRVREDVINKRIRWAITIIGIGYYMMFPAGSVFDLPYVNEQGWAAFWSVNILQLTGATMLLFVVTMASTRSVRQMGRRALWVTFGILVLTPFLQYTSAEQFAPLWLQDYLTTGHGSLFPIFPFGAYLFAGLAVGARLHEIPREKRDTVLRRYGWRIGGIILGMSVTAQYALAQIGVPEYLLEESMSVTLFLRRAGVVLMFFSLAVVILDNTWGMRRYWALFGTKSLWIYIIHLVLLFGTPGIDGLGRTMYRQLSLGDGIAVAVAIITLTLCCAWTMDWFARQPWASRWMPRIMATTLGAITIGLLI